MQAPRSLGQRSYEAPTSGEELREMTDYNNVVIIAGNIARIGIPREFGADIAPVIPISEAPSHAVPETAPVRLNAEGEPIDMGKYRREQAARQAVAEALASAPPAQIKEAA